MNPFSKLKVKIKTEVVKLRINNLDLTKRGKYIKASTWNAFTNQNDVVVLDTRNAYEYSLGAFEDAINPQIETFSDFAC
ncbi:hypothetical protein FZC37_00270 [Candidatus Sneabacter namystus]|uniref:Rhodanese domain-containing protein n=2 Tax=Candidatus Sneabacter namystus TaxID=2601646 RepID=A0A5C0UIP2_9RICK|nr:hypothetical protein FZC37_00270 [Candidatus Sneabacter namystus]